MFYRRRMSEYQQELSLLNQFPENKLYEEFFKCCGSPGWVREMLKLRPFGTAEQLFDKANQVWWNLPKEEWMNAFAAHPKIGDKSAFKAKFSKQGWESNEQSGTNTATDEVLESLALLNNEYELKNGFIFIICATGKSAVEMLTALQHRIHNDTVTEMQIAAGEQSKIVKLRLVKLLQSLTDSIPSSKL